MRLALVVAVVLAAALTPGCVQTQCPTAGDPVPHALRIRTLSEPTEPGLTGNGSTQGLWIRATEGGTEGGSFRFHVDGVRMRGSTVHLSGQGQRVDGLSGLPEYDVSDVWINRTLEPGTYSVRLCTEHRFGPETDRVDITRHRLAIAVA